MINFSFDSMEISSYKLAIDFLYNKLIKIINCNRPIIVLCIGTDRSAGDSLGPFVGSMLLSYKLKNFHVYGTLEKPVHALNLTKNIESIFSKFHNPYIIAVDASLGNLNDIGKVYIDEGPLYPGLALDKDLSPIGDLNITGLVNISGKLDYMILQNTRLYTVISIAKSISSIIQQSYNKIYSDNNSDLCI